MKKQIILIVAFLSMFGVFFAQTVRHDVAPNYTGVTGKVSDSSGNPLIGASVTVKGTTHGSVTGVDGKFTLINVPKDAILHVSYMGYVSTDIPVNSSSLTIVLKEEVKKIDEIVVIGYGKQKRKDITGSISSITGEELRETQPVTIDQALQGKVPGVVTQQISGQPGGAVSVQVRGISSFGGSSPLYVIDGVIIGGMATLGSGTNSLAGLNPSEIQSIDVLKDASATAIYGSQATNGVIVITTKRGQVSAPRISYEFYTGFQQLAKRYPTMDLQEYATFINERAVAWNFDVRPEFANPQYLGKGTDWQKELFRNAPTSNHTITISGGDARTQYMLSGSYSQQEGIALGSDFKRLSVRLNLDNKTTNWLKIGTSLQLAKIADNVNSSSSSVISTALSQTPDIAVKNADGSWGGRYNDNGWITSTANPYAIALINKDKANRYQFIGNAYAEVDLAKDLQLRNEVAGTFSMATEDKFNPTYSMGLVTRTINSGSYNFTQSVFTTVRNYLTYSHVFASKYSTNVMAGHEAQLNTNENTSSGRSNYPSNTIQVINSGDATTATNSGNKGQSAQESYFGRINFGINDKYLVTGNLREDGSSKFAKENRWVATYSGAFAWKINNENFLKGIKNINELKLRLGYGLTNNQNIRDYAYTSTLASVATGLSGVSQLTQNMANPYVKWEKTKNTNIGLDGALFNWRMDFSLDFYDRRTDGLLMQASLPYYSGTAIGWSPGSLDAPYINVGTVNNKGFDFRISSTNVRSKNFTWKTDLTVSRNINKVIKLNTDGSPLMGTYSKTIVGRSIGEFYGYVVEGVYSTADQLQNHPKPTKNGVELPVGASGGSIWYGDLMFKDLNGDKVIDEKDQTFIGSPIPKVQLGFNNSISYRNFTLNVFFSANVGNKVFNQLRVAGEYPTTSYGYLKSLKNYAKLALIDPAGSATDINNVYVVNPDTKIVGLRNDNTNDNTRTSDKYVEDGSFLKCKNISLEYNFSENLLRKISITSLKIYMNVTNAFTLTKYTGMDPEIGSWDPLNAGVDYGFYPQPRVFTFGLNVSLNK